MIRNDKNMIFLNNAYDYDAYEFMTLTLKYERN